jgi:hypothetical protein
MLICCSYSSLAVSAPWIPPVRDGNWLQNGIKQQQRWNAHQTLSEAELNDATIVTSYVCADIDLQKYLVQRAALLTDAVEGKKKPHLDRRLLAGMTQAAPILVPLIDTDFPNQPPSCDHGLVIVQEYLQTYPEMLDKDAAVIVEKALLEAYQRK